MPQTIFGNIESGFGPIPKSWITESRFQANIEISGSRETIFFEYKYFVIPGVRLFPLSKCLDFGNSDFVQYQNYGYVHYRNLRLLEILVQNRTRNRIINPKVPELYIYLNLEFKTKQSHFFTKRSKKKKIFCFLALFYLVLQLPNAA